MRPIRMRACRRLTLSEYRMGHLTAIKLVGKVNEAGEVMREIGCQILGEEVLSEAQARLRERAGVATIALRSKACDPHDRKRRLLVFRPSGLVHVLDIRFIDQQVRPFVAVHFQTGFVIPLDDAVKDFSILQNDDHRSLRLHLFDVVKVFGVRLVGWNRLLRLRFPNEPAP